MSQTFTELLVNWFSAFARPILVPHLLWEFRCPGHSITSAVHIGHRSHRERVAKRGRPVESGTQIISQVRIQAPASNDTNSALQGQPVAGHCGQLGKLMEEGYWEHFGHWNNHGIQNSFDAAYKM